MRIIAGTLKRKTIASVPGMDTRPTSDRLRESLFNILGLRVHDARVLDLFAGTGALGLEALSRGALNCVFVDNQKKALAVIRKNIDACALSDRSQVFNWDISRNLRGFKHWPEPFDLVFMDPPYNRNLMPVTLSALSDCGCLAQGAYLVCEHAANDTLDPIPPSFTITDSRSYGKTRVSFLAFSENPVSFE